jgi:hypothetical protein
VVVVRLEGSVIYVSREYGENKPLETREV